MHKKFSIRLRLIDLSKTLLKYFYLKLKNIEEIIYVLFDSNFLINKKSKTLFLDLGSNIGQGYKWFSNFYKKQNIDFELFEPNPYCFEKLRKLQEVSDSKISIWNFGVGVKKQKVKFYGLTKDNKYSLGGSILKRHNSLYYKNNDDNFIEVELIDLEKYLIKKSKEYDKIILKMDIEGAEVKILEKLIKNNTIGLIDILYVEFHSQYLKHQESKIIKAREKKIIKHLKSKKNFFLRIWH